MADNTKQKDEELNSSNQDDFFLKNGLEEELDKYTKSAVHHIRFALIIKPAMISVIALFVSFFLDLSFVPILGNITMNMAQSLFPNWKPDPNMVSPYSFWWLPLVVYALFLFLAYLAYSNLKLEIIRTPASQTIDRIIDSYTSVIDSISTALPLIGAAILLISIRFGEEVFLGLSVPFEVKALIVLALGKLFEPVLDELGVKFQNVVNHVQDIKDRYFSRIQIENSRALIKQFSSQSGFKSGSASVEDISKYKELLVQSSQLSEVIMKNFSAVYSLVEKINNSPSISPERLEQLKGVATSIHQASTSLSDEKTVQSLKHLEAIVVKK